MSTRPTSGDERPRTLTLVRATALVLLGLALAVVAAPQSIIVMPLTGAIGPSSADFVERGLARAGNEHAQLVVLQIDTPGGLDRSMRDIIKAILASPVPVAAFVAPSGARAASAGTYILYASHVAAMAPATNLGAATPVQIGGPGGEPSKPEEKPKSDEGKKQDKNAAKKRGEKSAPEPGDAMSRKAIHDASAYMRGLAELRGRNAEWGEKAVREAVSLPAEDAVKIKVADLIASDVPDLMKKVNAKTFEIQGQKRTLNTDGAELVRIEPDWRSRLLAVITDPSIAYILMLLGIYGLLFEFYNPGLVLPGVVGGICLLVALYAFQLLPVNYAGLALIVLGIGFMVGELFVTSYGALGIGGVIAFVLGSVMLIETDIPGYDIPWTLIASVSAVTAAFFLVVIGMALRARRQPIVSGREQLVGAPGEIMQQANGQWWARVHSEVWKVRSRDELRPGQKVHVTHVDGLVLEVEPDA